MMYGDTHYHGEYAGASHDHRGDYADADHDHYVDYAEKYHDHDNYADADHDHYLDYAEKYHRHHDEENLIARLNETLDSAAAAIRVLHESVDRVDRLEVARDRTEGLLQDILRRLEALEEYLGVTGS